MTWGHVIGALDFFAAFVWALWSVVGGIRWDFMRAIAGAIICVLAIRYGVEAFR